MSKSLTQIAQFRNPGAVMAVLVLVGAAVTSLGAAVGGRWSMARIPEAGPDAHPIWMSLLALTLVLGGALIGALIAAGIFAAACVAAYYPLRHRLGDGIHDHRDESPDEGTAGLADLFDQADLVDVRGVKS
ncbi:hypothetical protein [Kribbia dieselivorans]|uniref:hypothetical protein n=1 Tax=Kribbia dieselivorans TaxID=331526 RepID=UPI000838D5C6|nr:hypothetical protein [Kribbia dieselivorans]